jgi:hypothetical protein
MAASVDSFVKGLTAFRNARNLAERWRTEAIAHANAAVRVDDDDAANAGDPQDVVELTETGRAMRTPRKRA